jgi:hypothetical protein
MKAGERTDDAATRVGAGIGQALHRAFPADDDDAIAQVYPPDAACDDRFDALIERMRQIPWKKHGASGQAADGPQTDNPSPRNIR